METTRFQYFTSIAPGYSNIVRTQGNYLLLHAPKVEGEEGWRQFQFVRQLRSEWLKLLLLLKWSIRVLGEGIGNLNTFLAGCGDEE